MSLSASPFGTAAVGVADANGDGTIGSMDWCGIVLDEAADDWGSCAQECRTCSNQTHFSQFPKSGAKNILTQKAPLPVWVRVPMIGAVVRRTTEHVSIKLTFYFFKFHKSKREKPPFWRKNGAKSPISGLGETDDDWCSCKKDHRTCFNQTYLLFF